jgi:4-amino-4-deoxy-L-arabinose transferase-like glycosyltransferase
MTCGKSNRSLLVILAIALTVRLVVLLFALTAFESGHVGGLTTPDSQDYIALARSLRENGSLPADGVSVFRLPGYPAFLAGAFSITPRPLWAILQIAMDVLLVWVVYRVGCELMGRRVALVGALLQALSPLAAAASVRVLSDGPYALVFMLAVWWLVRNVRTGRWRWLVLSSVAMAAACLVRPVGVVMAAMTVAFLLARPGRQLRQAGVYVVLLAALLSPWVIRNGVRTGYWGLTNNFSVTLFGYSAAMTLEEATGQSPRQVQGELISRIEVDREDPDLGDLSAAYREVAVSTIAEHPATYAKLHLWGSLAFWLPGATDVLETIGLTSGQRGTLRVFHESGLLAAGRHYFGGSPGAVAVAVPLGFVYIARLVGLGLFVAMAAGRWRKLPPVAWWLIAIVVISWLIGGPVSTPRFRVPVEPLLSLAGAGGFVWAWRRRARRAQRAA